MATNIYLGYPPENIRKWILMDYNKKQLSIPLTFQSDSFYDNEGNVNTFSIKLEYFGELDENGDPPNKVNLLYSLNGEEWNEYIIGQNITNVERIMFKATELGNESFNQYQFVFNEDNEDPYVRIFAYGNIMSLLDPTGLRDDVPDYCFENLFAYNPYLISSPMLPASIVGKRCYANMFYCSQNLRYISYINPDAIDYSFKNNCNENTEYNTIIMDDSSFQGTFWVVFPIVYMNNTSDVLCNLYKQDGAPYGGVFPYTSTEFDDFSRGGFYSTSQYDVYEIICKDKIMIENGFMANKPMWIEDQYPDLDLDSNSCYLFEYKPDSTPITFTALEPDVTIEFRNENIYEYSINNGPWICETTKVDDEYSEYNNKSIIKLENISNNVRIRAIKDILIDNTNKQFYETDTYSWKLNSGASLPEFKSYGGNMSVSGNIMSLIDPTCKYAHLSNGFYLFSDCTNLISAKDLIMSPLIAGCGSSSLMALFVGAPNLREPPQKIYTIFAMDMAFTFMFDGHPIEYAPKIETHMCYSLYDVDTDSYTYVSPYSCFLQPGVDTLRIPNTFDEYLPLIENYDIFGYRWYSYETETAFNPITLIFDNCTVHASYVEDENSNIIWTLEIV